ncbi:MAG: hypothetical protein KC425_20700 [Anaerolineales bacterium]|nr:hypothetical protein [Anaerolineales bacterium]
MNQAEFEAFVAELPDVQRTENFGYAFFFVGDDHRLPFVTFANTDNDYDNVSHLDRAGVFRINIGVSRETFQSLFGPADSEPAEIDYTALDTFLPHPDYARQNFICILSPAGDHVVETKRLIAEAHAIAAARYQRTTKRN